MRWLQTDTKPIIKRNTVPVAVPRTKIEEKAKCLKGYSKTFEISIRNYTDPSKQNTETRKAIYHKLTQELVEMKDLKLKGNTGTNYSKNSLFQQCTKNCDQNA